MMGSVSLAAALAGCQTAIDLLSRCPVAQRPVVSPHEEKLNARYAAMGGPVGSICLTVFRRKST